MLILRNLDKYNFIIPRWLRKYVLYVISFVFYIYNSKE